MRRCGGGDEEKLGGGRGWSEIDFISIDSKHFFI